MRCERAAADSGDVHDVAFDTARTQICEAVLADPVAPDSGNRRGRFVAHRYFSSWCIDRCARGGLVAVLQFDARGFTGGPHRRVVFEDRPDWMCVSGEPVVLSFLYGLEGVWGGE